MMILIAFCRHNGFLVEIYRDLGNMHTVYGQELFIYISIKI